MMIDHIESAAHFIEAAKVKPMSKRIGDIAMFLVASLWLCACGVAVSSPLISLSAENGLIGCEFSASFSVAAAPLTSTGGFNGHIVFPSGMEVQNVARGDEISSGYFDLQFTQQERNFRFVVYSTVANRTISGEIFALTVAIDAGEAPGVRQLLFSEENPYPMVNSKHAVANVDGSSSLAHDTSNASFLIYTMTSDHDGDGMSDYYESLYGLDPYVDDAQLDSDGDGYTNLDEYVRQSDPKDPLDYNNCLGDEIFIPTTTYDDSKPYICRANGSITLEQGSIIVVSEPANVNLGAPKVVMEAGTILSVETGAIFSVD